MILMKTLKDKLTYFLSFLNVSFDSSNVSISFGIPIEVKKLVRDHGRLHFFIICFNWSRIISSPLVLLHTSSPGSLP